MSLSVLVLENIDEIAVRISGIEPAHAPTLIDGSVLNSKSRVLGTGERCIDVVDLD
jgi:hypothetical protein